MTKAIRSSLLPFTLFVLATACSLQQPTAGKSPKNTNAITRLSPQEARLLVAEFKGVQGESEYCGMGRCLVEDSLLLNGLTALDVETGVILAACGRQWLLLNGLATISDDALRALTEFEGEGLSLDGLTTLSATAAETLAKAKCQRLSLNGVTTISPDAAHALSDWDGRDLALNGLAMLSPAVAKALAGAKTEELSLNGLNDLPAEAARALAKWQGQYLSLDGLTTLNAHAAEELAEFQGEHLRLNGLTTLGADAAKALARLKVSGLLGLNALTSLTPSTAKPLAGFQGQFLDLNGLTTLDGDTAEALTGYRGAKLSLNGLTNLDADAAKGLAGSKCEGLNLFGLTTLDAATARALADYGGVPCLPEHVRDEFVANNPLGPHSARAYALLFHGDLPCITAFESPDSIAVAEALTAHKGRVWLPNLKRISPKTLTALIQNEDVEIPPVETLEFIQEPDGSATIDFVVPNGFRERQNELRNEREYWDNYQ